MRTVYAEFSSSNKNFQFHFEFLIHTYIDAMNEVQFSKFDSYIYSCSLPENINTQKYENS